MRNGEIGRINETILEVRIDPYEPLDFIEDNKEKQMAGILIHKESLMAPGLKLGKAFATTNKIKDVRMGRRKGMKIRKNIKKI